MMTAPDRGHGDRRARGCSSRCPAPIRQDRVDDRGNNCHLTDSPGPSTQ